MNIGETMSKIVALCCSAMTAAHLLAATMTLDGISWSFTISDGAATLGGGMFVSRAVSTSTTGHLVIPEMLGDYSVTSIRNGAFLGCRGLLSVTIPGSVTNIGYRAFCGCSGLTNFIVNSSNFYFKSERGLLLSKNGTSLVAVPGGLSNVIIPGSVTEIRESAFEGCTRLSEVEIPEGVKSIGDFSFCECDGLTNVSLPNSVTNIGFCAFARCNRLTSMVIPDSVSGIGERAFADCHGLARIVMPNTVKRIKNSAFEGTGLKSVAIPDSVEYIGEKAFAACNSLANVVIGRGVTNIGNSAFADCNELLSFEVEAGNRCFKSENGLLLSRDGKKRSYAITLEEGE